jgi:PEP-CTERM motif
LLYEAFVTGSHNTYYGSNLDSNRSSFFVYAQQDAGYQNFWNIDASDANFAKFRSVATNTANIVWAIVGQDFEIDEGNQTRLPGEFRSFITLQIGTQAGVESGSYSKLKALANGDFDQQADNVANNYLLPLNIGAKPFNTHMGPNGEPTPYAVNGSSYDAEGTEGYFGKNLGALATFGTSCGCSMMNAVGSSFYSVTRSNNFDDTVPVLIDEFDNLGHDGYFGFAQNPANGSFVLSYTLAAFSQSAAATTAGGKARASLTEYIASSGSRLLTAPVGEFAGYVMPLSPVPEPSSLLLMAGGLAGLVWQRRKRVHERLGAAPRNA